MPTITHGKADSTWWGVADLDGSGCRLDVALNQALAPWRAQQARHPAKVLLDLSLVT